MNTKLQQANVSSLPYISTTDFEGPFDVLLELAKAYKIDISQVSLQQITDDFLSYVGQHTIPTDQQLDFLLVTCTLLLLKVQRALPDLSPDEEEEVLELTDRLRIYQLYRAQAHAMRLAWQRCRMQSGPIRKPHITYADITITSNDLQNILTALRLKAVSPRHATKHLRSRSGRSLTDCIALLQERLNKVSSLTFADFTALIGQETTAVSFLAVLELARRGKVVATQSGVFTPITLSRS